MLKELVDMLKEEFNIQNDSKSNGIALPTSYGYRICKGTLYLTIKKVDRNMQSDEGAFDAWALGIKSWITDIKKIILIWERPILIENSHYQRFLYRVKKTTAIYDWLLVDDECIDLLDDLLIKESIKYVVNFPSKEAHEDPIDIEAIIEKAFSREYNNELAEIVGMGKEKIYRQLPVGIFKDKVAEINKVLSGSSATIDLWGINELENELHLFELKAKDNKPMGIYSQLFFYTMIQDDLINGIFNIDNPKDIDYRGFKYLTNHGYENIKAIKSHFLVNEIHPLIDKKMIDLINDSLKKKEKNIEFDLIKYEFDESHKSINLHKF